MYILKVNEGKLNKGNQVLSHMYKLNNVHDYIYVDVEKLKIYKSVAFNLYLVGLVA